MCCARPAAGALLRSDLTGYGGFARSGHDLSVKASRAGPDAGRRSTARHAAVGCAVRGGAAARSGVTRAAETWSEDCSPHGRGGHGLYQQMQR